MSNSRYLGNKLRTIATVVEEIKESPGGKKPKAQRTGSPIQRRPSQKIRRSARLHLPADINQLI